MRHGADRAQGLALRQRQRHGADVQFDLPQDGAGDKGPRPGQHASAPSRQRIPGTVEAERLTPRPARPPPILCALSYFDLSPDLQVSFRRQVEAIRGTHGVAVHESEQPVMPWPKPGVVRAAHHFVVRGEEYRVVQNDRTTELAGAHQRRHQVRHLDEAEAHDHMAESIGYVLDFGTARFGNPRCFLEDDGQGHDRFLERLELGDVIEQQRRNPADGPGQEHRGPRHAGDAAAPELREEAVGIFHAFRELGGNGAYAPVPGRHDGEDGEAGQQGNPAAVGQLEQVGREERAVDRQEDPAGQQRPERGPAPDVAHGVEKQGRGEKHGGGDRGAVGSRQPLGTAEADGQGKRGQHHRPVHEGHVDLAVLVCRGLVDVHAGEPAELHRLPGQRKRAGDDGLAGDDGGQGRQYHQRNDGPLRRQLEERIAVEGRILDQQGGLSSVAQQQGGQHDEIPGGAYRTAPEVAHVGIERLGAGDRQEHAAQHDETVQSLVREKVDGVARVDGQHDLGMPDDARQAEGGNGHEPQQHDRPEDPADAGRPARLRREQGQQNHQRGRHRIGLERVGQDVDAFEGAQHRDRRRDDAVAIDQGRPEHAQGGQRPRAPPAAGGAARDQGHEGQDAAFTIVVGAHDEQAVLERNRDDERPDDERQQPHGDGDRGMTADRADDGLVGVERARSEIAKDDADGRQRGGGRRAGCGGRRDPGGGQGHGALHG